MSLGWLQLREEYSKGRNRVKYKYVCLDLLKPMSSSEEKFNEVMKLADETFTKLYNMAVKEERPLHSLRLMLGIYVSVLISTFYNMVFEIATKEVGKERATKIVSRDLEAFFDGLKSTTTWLIEGLKPE